MSFYDRLVEQFRPLVDVDDNGDFQTYLAGIAAMFEPVADWSSDTDDRPGWAVLMDPETTPLVALGWLAQFVGVRLRQGLPEEEQRARIQSTDGMRRGTQQALMGAAQQYLTGNKTVTLIERHGSPYRISVLTVTSETPDPAAVLKALLEQKPAGLVLTHDMSGGEDYTYVRGHFTDYTDLRSAYTDYDHMRQNT